MKFLCFDQFVDELDAGHELEVKKPERMMKIKIWVERCLQKVLFDEKDSGLLDWEYLIG